MIDSLIKEALERAALAAITPRELWLGAAETIALRNLINASEMGDAPYGNIEGITFMGLTVRSNDAAGAVVR